MKPAIGRLTLSVTLALAVVLAATGCATHRISKPNQWAHATFPESETKWTFFWGLMKTADTVPANCQGPGLSEVTVKDNLGFDFISVVTLGIAMPVTIEWRCAKDKPGGSDDF